MRRQIAFLTAAGLLVLGAPAARATVHNDPVRVRMVGEPKPAVAGQVYSGTFEITAAKAVRVTNLRVEGVDWSGSLNGTPAALDLSARESRLVRFEASPRDPEVPLVVAYEVDGKPVRRALELSEKAVRLATGTGALVAAPAGTVFTGSLRLELEPRPTPRSANWTKQPKRSRRGDSSADDDPGTVAIQRTIRVHGRIFYTRSDGVTVGADNILVEVWDEDDVWDDYMDGELTDASGNFDINASTSGTGESDPDLYVYVEAINSELQVQSATWEINYSWQTGTRNNFSGSDWNVGSIQPDESGGAMHIFTDIIHDWRWYVNNEGYNLPSIDVQWPDGSTGAYYNPFWEEIHVGSDRTWKEDTHGHEYGHHFINNYAVNQEPDYCNAICDSDYPDDCGHCMWCGETDHDAWNEGWPDWIGHVQATSYAATYGIAAANTRNMESVAGDNTNCPGPLQDPLITEGFCGAVLQDIWDNTPGEDDPLISGTWQDRLSLGTNEIFDVVDADAPTSPWDFLFKFKSRFPQYTAQLWETAKNCGYEMDTWPPDLVTNLGSSTHAINDPASPDASIAYTWTRADDDASGVSGYSIVVNNSSGTVPDQTTEVGDVTGYTASDLDPGNWWIHVRTKDRSGKWSTGAAHFGPIDIRARQPVDLVYYPRAGWAHVLVPRDADDATISVVSAPTTLPGNSSGTWWNVSGRNTGDDPTGGPSDIYFLVDGAFRQTYTWGGSIAPLAAYHALNQGPLNIAGGRHTAEGVLDADEDILEGVESDNLWAHQWVWTPYALTAGVQVARGLPDRDGGRDEIVDGSSSYFNCDGLRFSTSGWWNAVWVYTTYLDGDRDCRLHTASTGATSGFTATNLGFSMRAAGCLDAVLVNKNVAAAGNYDVGVLNFDPIYDPFSSSYRAKHVTSVTHPFGTTVAVTMPVNEMLLLREFQVISSDSGWVSATVKVTAGGIPVHVLWLNDAFSTGDLMDDDAQGVTDETGDLRLDFYVAQAGYNCLVIYRDQKDGLGQVDLTVEIGKTKPDLTPVTLANWYAPLVPRPANDGLPAAVPAPTSLAGNSATTYWNLAFQNQAPVLCPGQTVRVYLDGVSSLGVGYGTTGRNATRSRNDGVGRTVRGGRHTATLLLDTTAGVLESDEGNNGFGEQWVWSPLPLALGAPVSRLAPPDPTGGWADMHSEAPRYFNCDGLRTPVFSASGQDGYWAGVATMPGAASDVDLRLHAVDLGIKNGFAASLASSGWGAGLSDFALADFRRTPFGSFDAGVVLGSGAEGYMAETVGSMFRGTLPSGDYGPYTLGANRILDLHEFWLNAGTWDFELVSNAGTIDWGITLYGDSVAYYSKSGSLADGASWSNGPGADERMFATVPEDGDYCLAVWKAGAADLPLSGGYVIRVNRQTVSAPGRVDSPLATALAPAFPNPCQAGTSIEFALARECEVALEIYDLRGARVGTVAQGPWPPGRHRVEWRGLDGTGRPLANGVYLIRLAAGPYHATRKLVVMR